MPIFEYQCPDCGEEFEEIRRHAERDEPIPCPKCSGRRPQRQISLFASSFAGAVAAASCSPRGGFS
jgi:putative FmdB family regulatory protein